jgi:hypothetical protein
MQEKLVIRSSINNWIQALQSQFRLDQVEAAGRMATFVYTDEDCKQGRDIESLENEAPKSHGASCFPLCLHMVYS